MASKATELQTGIYKPFKKKNPFIENHPADAILTLVTSVSGN
jgi:hypothetical protein